MIQAAPRRTLGARTATALLRLSFAAGLAAVLVAPAAASPRCESRHAYGHADGTPGCVTALPIAGERASGWRSTLAQSIPPSGLYNVATSERGAQCPAVMSLVRTDVDLGNQMFARRVELRSTEALAECRRALAAAGAAPGCDCRVVLEDGRSPLGREALAAWLGTAAAPTQQARAPDDAGAMAAAKPAVAAPTTTSAATAATAATTTSATTSPPPGALPTPPAPTPSVLPSDAPTPATAAELAVLRAQLGALQQRLDAPPANTPQPALPPPRLRARALVIGNAAYAGLGPLANPANDARAIAAAFRGFGIDVDLVIDASRAALVQALAAYQQSAAGYDVNILFYAGHGLQVDGINYLVPVDMPAEGATVGSVKLNTVSLNDLLEYLPAPTRVVFLDACRDNPLTRSLRGTRSSVSAGLAPVHVSSGTLVSYATRDGATADDGRGRHSPYTQALLAHVGAEDDVAIVLRRVRQSVLEATGQRQEPWEYGSLVGERLVLSQLGGRRR